MKRLFTLILTLATLTACSAKTAQPSESSSETEVTSAAVSAQTTAATNAARKEREYIDISDGTRFIDFDFIEDCKGSEISDGMKNAAMRCLTESEYYKDSTADTDKLRAEKDDKRHDDNRDYYDYERFYDKSGRLVPIIHAAYPDDYDGNGTTEAFVLADIPIYIDSSYPTVRSYLIFVSAEPNGYNAEILDDFSLLNNPILLDYGECRQLIIGGDGIMGADDHDVIYGVIDGKAKELYAFRGSFTKTECFLGAFGWSNSGGTLYYDTVQKSYVTIGGVPLEWQDVIAMDSTGVISDYDRNEFSAELIGGKYYCVYMSVMDSGTIYTYENGKFVPSDDKAIRHFDGRCCIGIDIDKAYSEMLTPAEAKAAADAKRAADVAQKAAEAAEVQAARDAYRKFFEQLPPEMCTKLEKSALVNTDGTLTEAFTKRTAELTAYLQNDDTGREVLPGFFDFDCDGVPEIFVVDHSGAQGCMPCFVYNALDLSYMGEFSGYCRNGFTRFCYSEYDNAAIICNYYEHSNWLREEYYDAVTVKNGKLEITEVASVGGQQNYGECYPTISFGDESLKKARAKAGEYRKGICRDAYSICAYDHHDWAYKDYAKNTVWLYNTYITLKASADLGKYPEYEFFIFVGDGAYYSNGGDVRFIYPDKKTENLGISCCSTAYRLWDGITVFQPLGSTMLCEVYEIKDGKPHKIEELSGVGQSLDFSPLYNECYTLTRSAYDTTDFGVHTFTDYLFGWDYDSKSFKEYGSIKLTADEFKAVYGKSAQKYIDEIETHANITKSDFIEGLAPEKGEITEVLYRADEMFIINYRIPIMGSDPNIPDDESKLYGYKYGYITLKPLAEVEENKDGGLLKEIERDSGNYLTALTPENAVYPESKPSVLSAIGN